MVKNVLGVAAKQLHEISHRPLVNSNQDSQGDMRRQLACGSAGTISDKFRHDTALAKASGHILTHFGKAGFILSIKHHCSDLAFGYSENGFSWIQVP